MTAQRPDLLVVGAGPVGCVVAEQAASQLGWRCLIVEQRDHIGGNCHDYYHDSGVLVHRYGPHYFRTNSRHVLGYLSRFTDWIAAEYIVKSRVGGEFYPVPINLLTLENFFGRSFTAAEAEAFLAERRIPCEAPKNSEELMLSAVGPELYEAFFVNYTSKQWGLHPRMLHPSVLARVPLRLSRDCRYVDHRWQQMPARGYIKMIGAMIDHPLIEVQLDNCYSPGGGAIAPRLATVYCGPLDRYFDRRLGALPWRSLRFEMKYHERDHVQPCVQINHPNDHRHTRTVEIKWVTGQRHPGTVVSYEYPEARGEPYYPVPVPANERLQREYLVLAEREERERNVFFCGRQATYKYIDIDQAIESAFALVERLRPLSAKRRA